MKKLMPYSSTALAIVFIFAQLAVPIVMIAQTVNAETGSDPAASTTNAETAEPATEPAPTKADQPPEEVKDPYVYNKSTGLWENSKYTWNPQTHQTQPNQPQTYSYNPGTDRWDTTDWQYDNESGQYEANDKPPTEQKAESLSTMPQNTITPQPYNADSGVLGLADSIDTSIDESPYKQKEQTLVSDALGSGSMFDLFYDAAISNSLKSFAHSGDAAVTHNTFGGNAMSGDASAIATILTMLQSTWGLDTQDIATFISNIDGDVVGDLYIDPAELPKTSVHTAVDGLVNDIDVRVSNNTIIDNDIHVEAVSGQAEVSSNTSAGNATTGNATTMANILNLINASIAAGDSFIGTINIHGSLDGDILLPRWLQNHILASGVSQAATEYAHAEPLDVDTHSNIIISNELVAQAETGQATVASNTSAGNATSGDATTNITLLNLTGQHVIANNSLLVFVNVLGEWVGLILDAPSGTSSAMLASGVAHHSVLPLSGDINIENTTVLNNRVTANARTGDAMVAHNTLAGNATSGDARSAINVLNIANSQFSLSEWFGVLFINVFGSWRGSFGVDTAAGTITIPPPPQDNPEARAPATTAENSRSLSGVQSSGQPSSGVFRFAERANTTRSNDVFNESDAAVLGAEEVSGPRDLATISAPISNDTNSPRALLYWILAAASLIGLIVSAGMLIRRPRGPHLAPIVD